VTDNVLDSFFGTLVNTPAQVQIKRLVIVSPWITSWTQKSSSLRSVIKTIRNRRLNTTIITRPPAMDNHISAVEELSKLDTVEILTVPNLHAKYYVMESVPYGFAMISSANSTQQSFSNIEIGVSVRGRGMYETVITQLRTFTHQLSIWAENY